MDLKVLVFLNQESRSLNKRVFERIVKVPVGIDVPYSSLVSNLKFLFGVSSIVLFELV